MTYTGMLGLGGLALFSLVLMQRSGHFFKTFLFTALTGIGALLAVCWFGAFTGVLIAVNPFTLAVSGTMGIPGVLVMLALRLLFKM